MINKEILKNTKFFIGPMSKNIVDTIIEFSNKNNSKFGIIPSRRQIDYDGGYVNDWNTKTFFDYINKERHSLILERDHGGINQGRVRDNGIISFYNDANLFDIIHIDPWYSKKDFYDALTETVDNIKFINLINPSCLFEVGTEESIYFFDEYHLEEMLYFLGSELGDLFNKIAYCVIQSGTKIKGTKNIGTFELKRLEKMLKICNKYNVLSKEHNGDYLTKDQLKMRFDAGLSAINIAPEFGVCETTILLEYMTSEQKEIFFDICYKSNTWKKWVNNFNPLTNKNEVMKWFNNPNKYELMKICGHYQFSDKRFKDMNINIDHIIKEKIYDKLSNLYKI